MNEHDLRSVVEAAVRAPSVHNTQPWRFDLRRENGVLGGLDIFADPARTLGVIDPTERELYISCGATIEFARVAMRNLGHTCSVHLVPDPGNVEHVAFIETGDREAPTGEEQALAGAIETRYTERDRFTDRPVPEELIAKFRKVAARLNSWVRVLDQPGDAVAAAVLLAHADDLEQSSPDYERELATWSRREPGAKDGIPISALPSNPVEDRASSFRLRQFDPNERAAQRSTLEVPLPAEHPLVILLGTGSDDQRAWLEAGQALGGILLQAAAEGVFASPMTQVLEVPASRGMLAEQLGLVGYPQMLLRMGYASGHPQTPRRPVEDVLLV